MESFKTISVWRKSITKVDRLLGYRLSGNIFGPSHPNNRGPTVVSFLFMKHSYYCRELTWAGWKKKDWIHRGLSALAGMKISFVPYYRLHPFISVLQKCIFSLPQHTLYGIYKQSFKSAFFIAKTSENPHSSDLD